MICKECGQQLSDQAKFCGKCGTATGIKEPDKGEAQGAANRPLENGGETKVKVMPVRLVIKITALVSVLCYHLPLIKVFGSTAVGGPALAAMNGLMGLALLMPIAALLCFYLSGIAQKWHGLISLISGAVTLVVLIVLKVRVADLANITGAVSSMIGGSIDTSASQCTAFYWLDVLAAGIIAVLGGYLIYNYVKKSK